MIIGLLPLRTDIVSFLIVFWNFPPAPTACSSLSVGTDNMSANSIGTKVVVEPESTSPIVFRPSLSWESLIWSNGNRIETAGFVFGNL